MILSKKASESQTKEFFSSAIYSTLKNLLKLDDAMFLTRALVSKQTKNELLDFLESPIIVVDGENSVLVDNKFIKRQLLSANKIDVLENLHKAKIIIKNCNNISIKGLDVIYLLNNTVRLLSPDEQQMQKNDIFLAQSNKIITSINENINISISNSFKTMMHCAIDSMKNTKVLQKSSSTKLPESILQSSLLKSY